MKQQAPPLGKKETVDIKMTLKLSLGLNCDILHHWEIKEKGFQLNEKIWITIYFFIMQPLHRLMYVYWCLVRFGQQMRQIISKLKVAHLKFIVYWN